MLLDFEHNVDHDDLQFGSLKRLKKLLLMGQL